MKYIPQSIIDFPIWLDSHVMLLYLNAYINRPEYNLLSPFYQTQTSAPEWHLQLHPRGAENQPRSH